MIHGGIQAVDGLIARGGFGIVERVTMSDGTKLARKTFAPQVPGLNPTDVEKMRARFAREVKVQSSLSSPNFIPILHFDLSTESPWYLMPLAERNLLEEIQHSRASGQAPTSALADVLNALEEFHQLGFVHRDLKPQNVLLLKGTWRLTDFGLVLPMSSTTTKLTSTESAWGTAAYCAPEQAIDFKGVSAAADIYAFGCILHDIFSGSARIPYSRHTATGPIGAIIEKCTEVKAERRFKSVKAVRGTLLSLLATSPEVNASAKATEWVAELPSIASWTQEKAESFVRYLTHEADAGDKFVLLRDFSETEFEIIRQNHEELWKYLVVQYCDWVDESSFDFNYCDVLVRRLDYIFDHGDLESKAAAALAVAELGASHNRFAVMRYVVRMCGKTIDDAAGQRIAIEIQAADAQYNFRRCAQAIGQDIGDYHPRIAEVLASSV